MMETLLLLTALAGATYASYSDVKHGAIPNRLAFSLMLLGILSYTGYSIYLRDSGLLFLVLKNFILIFIVGYLFWLLGGWSAGDAKEFMFLAALVPQYPSAMKSLFNPILAPYPFSLTILFNTFLMIFPFITLYSLLLTYPKVGLQGILKPLRDYKSHARLALATTAAYSLAGLLKSPFLGVVFLLILIMMKNPKLQFTAAAVATVVSAHITGGYLVVSKGYLLFLILFASLRFFTNLVALFLKKGLRMRIKITELEEGMILAEEIHREDGQIRRDPRTKIERLIEILKTGKMKRRETLVQSSAAGVTNEEIRVLRELVRTGKLEDEVVITQGIPFAPPILIGFIVSITAGDLVFYLRGSI
jgi:preflagellin peptidase FlaK